MKTYTYFSKGSESVRLHSGEQGMIVVPFKEQPPDSADYSGIHIDHAMGRPILYACFESNEAFFNPACPLGQPGDIINVKEAFRVIYINDGTGEAIIQYKDLSKKLIDIPSESHFENWLEQGCIDAAIAGREEVDGIYKNVEYDDFRWRSPVIMPLEAVRTKLRVIKVTAKMVQELDFLEAKEFLHSRYYSADAYKANGWVWCIEVEKQ